MTLKIFHGVGFTTPALGTGRTGLAIGEALSNSYLTPAEAGAVANDRTNYVIRQGDDREWGVVVVNTDALTFDFTVKKSKIAGVVSDSAAIALLGAAQVLFTANGPVLTPRSEAFIFPLTDEVTAIDAGTNKFTFEMPYALDGVTFRASLRTAQVSGSICTIDVNKNGASMLSTKLTIDNTEDDSDSAATPAVYSSTSFAAGDKVTIDVDQVGTGGVGLKLQILGYRVIE